jgi:hypothetical protein
MYMSHAHYIGQQDRVDELNERIANRLEPNNAQPNFDPRPTSTKYSLFPMIDRRILDNSRPAVKSMTRDVDTENVVRGHTQRLDAKDSGDKYTPALGSDMYTGYVASDTTIPRERALLFQQFNQSLDQSIHPNLMSSQIGTDRFHNHTRAQLRNQS